MKRFTATEKWDKEWFQKLSPKLKCFWQYLCDRCDIAGVWEPNFPLASFQIGESVSERDLEMFGEDRIARLSSGKWFLLAFIPFQYGELSESCRPHLAIIKLLTRQLITDRDKGYLKGIHTLKDKDKDKDKDPEGGAGGNTGDANLPTPDEVVRFGSMGGAIPEDFCRHYHEQKEIKRSWLNGHGKMIDWRREIVKWWAQSRATWGQRSAPPQTANAAPKKLSVWAAKQKLEVVEEEIQKILLRGDSYEGRDTPREADKPRYRELRQKRQELKKAIEEA